MSKNINLVAAFGLALCAAASGCGAAGDASPSSAETQVGAERAIAEADIIKLDGDRLYAMSAAGTISIVDVSTPGRLSLLGQSSLGGTPFEMYRRGDLLVTMWNGAYTSSGELVPPSSSGNAAGSREPATHDGTGGAGVVVLDTRDPSSIKTLRRYAVPGEIADSRIVGDALYVATYENPSCYSCAPKQRTLVTSFDVSDATAMRKVDQVAYTSSAPDSDHLAWGASAWKRSIFATSQRLYIGGHTELSPDVLSDGSQTYREGIIDVLDISDPTGRLGRGMRLEVAGPILSRWQFDERNGVLRVISQRGAGRYTNGIDMPKVETFRVDSAQSIAPLGSTSLQMPRQEGLRTVRFDDKRAYAITFNQTDPLFTIDLQDPAFPVARGELHMPGYLFYLEPHGDRLIALGIDSTDESGSLNVSLIDVQDLARPQLRSRVPFGTPSVGSEYTIVNHELPEDQDRIQKAIRVFDDGIVAVPFTYANSITHYSAEDACRGVQGGVQLIDWANDSLTARQLLPVRGNPRRAFEKDGELIAVSDSNITSFSLAARGTATQTADLEIGPCALRGLEYWEGGYDDVFHFPFGCSAAPSRPQSSSGVWMCALVGLLALARRARRRTA